MCHVSLCIVTCSFCRRSCRNKMRFRIMGWGFRMVPVLPNPLLSFPWSHAWVPTGQAMDGALKVFPIEDRNLPFPLSQPNAWVPNRQSMDGALKVFPVEDRNLPFPLSQPHAWVPNNLCVKHPDQSHLISIATYPWYPERHLPLLHPLSSLRRSPSCIWDGRLQTSMPIGVSHARWIEIRPTNQWVTLSLQSANDQNRRLHHTIPT